MGEVRGRREERERKGKQIGEGGEGEKKKGRAKHVGHNKYYEHSHLLKCHRTQ